MVRHSQIQANGHLIRGAEPPKLPLDELVVVWIAGGSDERAAPVDARAERLSVG